MDPIADGADAELYGALNAAYGGALEYGGTITNVNTLALEEMADAAARDPHVRDVDELGERHGESVAQRGAARRRATGLALPALMR